MNLGDVLVLKGEEENDTYFLAFKLSNQNEVNDLVKKINLSLQSMRLPSYYEVYLLNLILNFKIQHYFF